MAQRNFNPIMAMAATVTIVEVENDIAAPGDLDPDQIQTPGIYVDRIVPIPEDGIWPDVAGGPSGTSRTFA
jgi:acyl CoA:acetate/3-ketoacid CoA transferase alpha subunit